jgi:hypothetical protein
MPNPKYSQFGVNKRAVTPDSNVKLPGIVDILEEEDRMDVQKSTHSAKTNLKDLVHASRNSRLMQTQMPRELYETIKVRPPFKKEFYIKSHQIDEPLVRYENSKNYSPQQSIINAMRAKKYGPQQHLVETIMIEKDTSDSFRDRLVDFLITTQNNQISKQNGTILNN